MPTAERYSRYREDQTTIWVSKTAAEFLSRERGSPGEGASAVLDRVINEYKKMRRSSGATGGTTGAAAPPAKSATKSATKGATKSAAKSAGPRSAKKAAAGPRTAKKAAKQA